MDNDVYGHVNNVVYYSYFDTVINEYLITQGGLDIHAGPVIGLCVESHCAYTAALAFPETVRAGLRVGKLGTLVRPLRDRPVRRGGGARRRGLVRPRLRRPRDPPPGADPGRHPHRARKVSSERRVRGYPRGHAETCWECWSAVLLLPGAAQAESTVPKVAWGNDFACVPSAAHPRPVVLLHGLGATARHATGRYVGPRLKAAGYCVFAITYGMDPRTRGFFYRPGGTIAAEKSAPEIGAFVDRVLAATGASKVDFVGHSEGTVTPRYYLERLGGAPKVDALRRADAAVARARRSAARRCCATLGGPLGPRRRRRRSPTSARSARRRCAARTT